MSNMKILNLIKQLPNNVYDFVKLDLIAVEDNTDKAAMICGVREGNNPKYQEIWETWFPLSQLRKDNNDNIWVSKWLWNKKLEEGEV